MTEKIKLTQKQASFIERGFKLGMDKEEMLNRFADAKSIEDGVAFDLLGLCVMDMARALLIGYEVEPEFKVGDWVKHELEGRYIFGQIDTTAFNDVIFNFFEESEIPRRVRLHKDDVVLMTIEEIAQEKERRKWAAIEEGDVLRKIPMAHEIGIYEGDADDHSILVRNDSGQHLWKKSQVELYAKKVGDE